VNAERTGVATSGRGRSSERRRAQDLDPHAVLQSVPARSLMERLSIPLVAVTDSGHLVAANDAFAALIGYPAARLAERTCDRLFRDVLPGQSMVGFVGERAEQVVLLAHADGHVVHAKMTRSVLLRRDESMALVAFTDVRELHWTEGRAR
jgi:PAS domain S-box-containing protein